MTLNLKRMSQKLKSVDYFAQMDIDDNELPPRLVKLMGEIDYLSDELAHAHDDDDETRISKELERKDAELLKELQAINKASGNDDDDRAWPSVDTGKVADNRAENHDDVADSASPYFWMQ